MRNMIACPAFHNRSIFEEDPMAIETNKIELLFNKPLYIGMAILDLCKIIMYRFL